MPLASSASVALGDERWATMSLHRSIKTTRCDARNSCNTLQAIPAAPTRLYDPAHQNGVNVHNQRHAPAETQRFALNKQPLDPSRLLFLSRRHLAPPPSRTRSLY